MRNGLEHYSRIGRQKGIRKCVDETHLTQFGGE